MSKTNVTIDVANFGEFLWALDRFLLWIQIVMSHHFHNRKYLDFLKSKKHSILDIYFFYLFSSYMIDLLMPRFCHCQLLNKLFI